QALLVQHAGLDAAKLASALDDDGHVPGEDLDEKWALFGGDDVPPRVALLAQPFDLRRPLADHLTADLVGLQRLRQIAQGSEGGVFAGVDHAPRVRPTRLRRSRAWRG